MSRPVISAVAPGRGRLPVPARDRRPALAALGLLLVLVGALGAALVVYRSGQRSDVLVASHAIRAGQQITSADLSTVRVSRDGGQVIPAGNEPLFVGSYAVVNIPNETLLAAQMFSRSVLPAGSVVVGVTVSQQNRPAEDIQTGDVVQVYVVPSGTSNNTNPGASGAPTVNPSPSAEQQPVTGLLPGQLLISSARVFGVTSGDTSAAGTTALTVSLLVNASIAPQLTEYAALNEIALGEMPIGTSVSPDLQRGSA